MEFSSKHNNDILRSRTRYAMGSFSKTSFRECDFQVMGVQVLILVLGLAFLMLVKRRYFSPIAHIPGPALASVSRLWHFRQIWSGKQNLKLLEQHDKHGHFVRMAHNEVSVTHPDGIRLLLLTPLQKGSWYKIVCFPDYTFTVPFVMLDPRDKNECSKYLSTGYLQHNVIKAEPAYDENIKKLRKWMDHYAIDRKPMDLDKFFTYVAFDIAGEVIFSKPFGFIDKGEDVRGSIYMNSAMEMYISYFGYMHWLHYIFSNPFVTWLGILPMGHLFDTTMAALNERQKNPEARFDLAAHWFRGLEKAKKDKSPLFNLRVLQSFATSNVGAGSDTVSAGLQSAVYHLIRHKDGWQRIRDEINSAQQRGYCHGQVISFDDASQLPYLQATIKEALRVLTPISSVTLTIYPSVIHRSKEIWGPDARQFNPDRWLEPDAPRKEKYFIPWGAGYASCPGQHVARIQLSKILATVIRDYDIRQVDPKKDWEWSAYFTVVPHDWLVYVSKREPDQ